MLLDLLWNPDGVLAILPEGGKPFLWGPDNTSGFGATDGLDCVFVFVHIFFFFFFCLFGFSRAAPAAYRGSQARGLIGAAAAAGLHQSHSKAGSKPRLQPTPQLTAMLDP